MKRSISFFAILSSLLILQGCCSLKIPAIEAQFPLIDELTCAGKGVHVSLDRFIIRLNVPMTDDQIVTMMELALPDHKPISLERCKCGDPDLMMIILGEAMENKGDLLTTVSGLRGGSMNSDPALVYKLKHSVYHKIPQLPASGGPLNPDIADFISDESDAMIVVVLDSGLDLNRFAGKKFLMQNPTGLNCIVGGEPSSGYNFIDNNTIIQDNEDKSHGTFVTKKIMEKLEVSGGTYKILPLKIAKNRLVSYWDLLCAMSFAKQIQNQSGGEIKIINASLGFRLNNNKLPLADILGLPKQMSILQKYIDDFSDSALMVTAAGNKGENVDNNSKFVYFPAGFDSENLMAVGGLKQGMISLHHRSNYGPTSIDIAAPYEHTIMNEPVGGTSIGTAQISASVWEFLNQNPNLNPIQLKTQFLLNASQSTSLSNHIKDGKYEQ